ncbi:hypothetical protein [Streptomyces sp. NPDC012510]
MARQAARSVCSAPFSPHRFGDRLGVEETLATGVEMVVFMVTVDWTGK